MMQFFKQSVASFIGTMTALLLIAVLGTSGLITLVAFLGSKDEGVSIKDKSFLVFDLSMPISDTQPTANLQDVLNNQVNKTMTLRQVIDSLERASIDPRIVGIFLDGRSANGTGISANLTEIKSALEKFQATGKKIIAYDLDSEPEYYLGSLADTIALNPMSTMQINGFASQPLFYTGALKKYGIGVQVVRVGNYKSAVEPFIRTDFSPENRQQTQALLDDLWQEFLKTVAKNRQISPEKLQEIVNKEGFLSAEVARQKGLIDQVAYFDQILEEIKKLSGTPPKDQPFPYVTLANYADVTVKNSQKPASKNKIAVIYAQGEIVDGQGNPNQIGGDSFAKELRKLREDKDIKAVVLRVNSPGGSATASDIILRELQLIKAKKPLIISMGNVAASGGYWISTANDRIFAQEDTITGSIGVFGLLFNFQEIATKNGITSDVVKTGDFADINSSIRPKTPAELALFQKYVNQTYDLFLEKVASSRKLPKAKVAEIAQGRVWSGKQAKAIGLVDQIGGLETAIDYAAQKAKLGNDWEIEEFPKQRSFETKILEKIFSVEALQTDQKLDSLTNELLKIKKDLAFWQNLNDPRGTYARMPFNLQPDQP